MPQVTFVPADFKAAYPEFTAVPDARLSTLFTMAEQSMLDNTDGSPVMDVNYRTQLFWLLVAHLAVLFGPGSAAGSATNTPPGRLSSATEGTVSSSFEYNMPTGSAMVAWYLQTKYGALFWTMTAQFRSAIYYAAGNSGVGFARAFASPPYNVPGGIIPS